MGIRSLARRIGGRAADAVASLSVLGPGQLKEIQKRRESYLSKMADPTDAAAEKLTQTLLAANAVEVYDAYLPQLRELYVPVSRDEEYEGAFDPAHNVRYVNITRWVMDATEDSLEKLVNVYDVLSDEECNIALVFHRTTHDTQVFLAVVNVRNDHDNVNVDNYMDRVTGALRGNFPGSEWGREVCTGVPPCIDDDRPYSVACASNIPTEKSESFVSQTVDKLLDGIVPANMAQQYTLILLASPIRDVGERKLRLGEIYSGLAPYASWQTNYTFTESDSQMSGATVGLNVGASAGMQAGTNQSMTDANATSDSTNSTESENSSVGETSGTTHSESSSSTHTDTSSESTTGSVQVSTTMGAQAGVGAGGVGVGVGESVSVGASVSRGYTSGTSDAMGTSVSDGSSRSIANTVGKAVSRGLGRAVTKTVGTAAGSMAARSLGANFGMNFARTSNVTATVGKNEGITQSFANFSVKHALDLLQEQMRRYEASSALGMWDFAAYVLSEDLNVANNVAHTYLALTQGELSYLSSSAVNLWRGDMGEGSGAAHEIYSYLRELRQPLFGISPDLISRDDDFCVYPPLVSAMTPLSGKELALSLNFPRKSLAGFPVIECAEFGRSVTTYSAVRPDVTGELSLGRVFHMLHEERTPVRLFADSLTSHVFVTGSTGSGKTNTVCQLLSEADRAGAGFLVVEPAKGEYKDAFGTRGDVRVFGTNPLVAPLLRLNPFAFPSGVHVLEHLDRLVEVFNVCWPMYAAMPAVLKEAVERSYEDCGWDLTESTNDYGEGLYPSFSDVARNVREILDTSEYDAENKGAYKGALLTRLRSLTNGINGMVFASVGLDDAELFEDRVIVDLSRVGSSETKSLLMGVLVLKLREYLMSSFPVANKGLRHLTVLEEAHNLLRRVSTEQPAEGANLLGKSVEMLTNAIAEMRAYGEGFVVVDQAPGLLDLAAIRNTNTKIIMRLPDEDDRQLVGRSANLNDRQIKELARLPQGVAAVYQNEWVEPVLCKVERFEVPSVPYAYVRPEAPDPSGKREDALLIAELLSGGRTVFGPERLKDLRKRLDALGVEAFVQVLILRFLQAPPAEPRMTRLGPVMSALFPDVRRAVVSSHRESAFDMSAWTRAASECLAQEAQTTLAEQVRRDIIQAIVTDYLYNELHDEKTLREWSIKGGLA